MLAKIQKHKNGKIAGQKVGIDPVVIPCPIDSPALEFCLDLASRHILSAFGRQRCPSFAMCT